jgi:hypothetical protein
MTQMLDTEQYIELVRMHGIEAAYQQRFRATGRTVREILKLTIMMSEGKQVHIMYGATKGRTGGNSQAQAVEVLRNVLRTAESFGMNVERSGATAAHFVQSGGRIAICPHGAQGRVPEWEQFELHDN